MNEEEFKDWLREKVAEQGVQLIYFCGEDVDLRIKMAGFMKDVMNTFLDFNENQRKLLLKFLIETDEFMAEAERKAKK